MSDPIVENTYAVSHRLRGELASANEGFGADMVVFAHPGARPRTVGSKLLEVIKLTDYAQGDGITEDSQNIQSLISAAKPGKFLKLLGGGKKYKVSERLLLPPLVQLDLEGATIQGPGHGTAFESAYWNHGVLVSNFGTPPESNIVFGTQVRNGFFDGYLTAFNLYNFNENSLLEELRFTNCLTSVYTRRGFYGTFRQLMSRTRASGKSAAYIFDTEVNAVRIDQLFSVTGDLAFQFVGPIRGGSLSRCSAEECATGIVFKGGCFGLAIKDNYFEYIEGNALDFSDGSNYLAVDIDNNYFNKTGKAIYGKKMLSGRWGRGNVLDTGSNTVDISVGIESAMLVEIPKLVRPGNHSSIMPPAYKIGPNCEVDFLEAIEDPYDKQPTIVGKYTPNIVPFHYRGNSGIPVTHTIPFCNYSISDGIVNIDTKIPFTKWVMLGFVLTIVDDSGSHEFEGFILGTKVLDATLGHDKTVTVSNHSGFLQMNISAFLTTRVFSATGIVRHL